MDLLYYAVCTYLKDGRTQKFVDKISTMKKISVRITVKKKISFHP